MKKVKAERLTLNNFRDYGNFISTLSPEGPKIGEEPIEFYRDMLQVRLGQSNTVSVSVCRVKKRELIISCVEYHSNTSEGFMPLDGDVIMHVLPATPIGELDVNNTKAFIVPRGTLVNINAGVWHYAPYPIQDDYVNVLVILPERTYANDCKVVILDKDELLFIEKPE